MTSALIPRKKVDAALATLSASMLAEAERSLQIAHLYGDLRAALALCAGCALVRGPMQIEALAPLPRMLGGIMTALVVAVQPRSLDMRTFVKTEVQALVTEYITAIEGVINGREGADDTLIELTSRYDDHLKALAVLRETTKPGPKSTVTTRQIKESTCLMVLGKMHAGKGQEEAIQAVHNELSMKDKPDALERAILSRLDKSKDRFEMVRKWLQSSGKINFSHEKRLT
jgi:hypothetical protein